MLITNRKLSTGTIQNFNESTVPTLNNDYIGGTGVLAVADGVSSKYN